MPTKARGRREVRKGPQEIRDQYEAQMEILGIPFDYVKTMMLPEAEDPRRVPDEVVATSAIFKVPQIVDNLPVTGFWDPALGVTPVLTAGDPGQSTVIVVPGTRGAIYHTSNTGFNIQAGGRLAATLNTHLNHSNADKHWMTHGLRWGQKAVYPRLVDAGYPVIEVGTGIGGNLTVSATTDTKFTGIMRLTIRYWLLGVGTNITENVDCYNGHIEHIFAAPIPAGQTGLSLGISRPAGTSGPDPNDWTFSMSFSADIVVAAQASTSYEVVDIEKLSGMIETAHERTTALSALVTYMGSDLANGGNITAARLPKSTCLAHASRGDYYAYISSLPFYASDMKLRDGAYAWWCPDSEQEYFFRPHNEVAGDDLSFRSPLVFTMKRDDPTQTVRLRTDLHLETLTRSPLYNSEVSNYSASFPKALEVAKTFPAVTINDDHQSLLSKAWGAAKRWLSSPDNWATLLKQGAKLLSFL